MKPSTNILNSLIPFDYGTHQKPNRRCRLKISVHSFPFLTVRIPWNQCDQKLNENCTALLTIKVSAQIWLASVNSWRRSSSFTKCRKTANVNIMGKFLHGSKWTNGFGVNLCSHSFNMMHFFFGRRGIHHGWFLFPLITIHLSHVTFCETGTPPSCKNLPIIFTFAVFLQDFLKIK
jgi:hypothetical protein